MLSVIIPGVEGFDEIRSEFVETSPAQKIQLEHSLLSLSKWESKWHKPFLHTLEKKRLTSEEILDYIRCMTLTKNVDPDSYDRLPVSTVEDIWTYMANPMTATTIRSRKKGKKEILTNEVIYYMMFKYNIPIDCEKWHINRLFTLLRVAAIKGGPDEKMPFNEVAKSYREINEMNKRLFGSK